jgi:cell division protein FtsL
MAISISKIKDRLPRRSQLVIILFLVASIIVIVKQQYDINALKSEVQYLGNNIDEQQRKLNIAENDLNDKIDNVESDLQGEIEDVKRYVRIWSN